MMKNLIDQWNSALARLRSDEEGAEATEVILILVVVVIGLLAAFAALRNMLTKKTSEVTQCIDGANIANNCK